MEEIISGIVRDFAEPTPEFIIAQVLGLIALVCTVTSMQLKSKRGLMVLQTLSELFIVLQYLSLGAWAGGLISCVSLVRDFVLTKFYGKKRAPLWFLILLYLALVLTTSYSVFVKGEGWIALLPFFGSVFYATTLWRGDTKWIRVGNAVGNTPYIIYTFITKSYILAVMTVIEVVSAWVGFFRIDVFGAKKAKVKRVGAKRKKSKKR